MSSSPNLKHQVINAVERDVKSLSGSMLESDCFIAKPANQWVNEAKNRPIPNMLCGELWYEGEVCILFADTNVGKSILATQIADCISKGIALNSFRCEVFPQNTIYLDFELSDKQFEKRYSHNYEDHYQFSDKLIRAEINSELQVPKEFKSFEEYLIHSLELLVVQHNAKVIVIDNITYLKTDNEKAKDALALMKELKGLSKKFNISILVLAHTPKREFSKPLTKNDLAGSKMLINFCDSAFAIGESSEGSGLRYVKQIKQRNTECVYHSENIALFEIVLDFNFLKFEFIGFDRESNHISQVQVKDKEQRNHEIIELHNSGLNNSEIAKQLGISEGTVRYQLKKAS